jgi:ABC-2 type transport system permease protein
VFFVCVLLSNVLFFGTLMFTRMGDLFYGAASLVQSRASVLGRWTWFRSWEERRHQARLRRGFMERLFDVFRFIPPDARAIIVKDIRIFWRDTTQWAQTLVLFGLIAVYIINLRHFSAQLTNTFWITVVAYLNLGACALNLATLTTRFVYPQFSLEGKRLWIVGMAPLGLVRVVRVKFHMALSVALAVTVGLILLSCHMLNLPWDRTIYFSMIIAVMTYTLTGLAVGLGVLYPNFREDNPGKIVSGFGGTFCLVLSFLYILASVVLLAFSKPWGIAPSSAPVQSGSCLAGFMGLSVLLGWVPLRVGFRRLRTFEA